MARPIQQNAPIWASLPVPCRRVARIQIGGSRVVMYVLTQIPFDELQALTVRYGETVGPA